MCIYTVKKKKKINFKISQNGACNPTERPKTRRLPSKRYRKN